MGRVFNFCWLPPVVTCSYGVVISKLLGVVQTHMQEEFKLKSIMENRKDF